MSEWAIAIVLPTKLMDVTHPWAKRRMFAPTISSTLRVGGGGTQKQTLEFKGAFHSTKIPGSNFRNFRMSNGTVFSTRPDRSRSSPTWAHFPPRITWQNAEGSWWSGCFKCCIKLLHVEKLKSHSELNSSLIFYTLFIWEELTNFSRGRVRKPGELTQRKFRTTSPHIFQEIRS